MRTYINIFRLYPALGFISRIARHDIVVGGYRVSPGVSAILQSKYKSQFCCQIHAQMGHIYKTPYIYLYVVTCVTGARATLGPTLCERSRGTVTPECLEIVGHGVHYTAFKASETGPKY